MTTLRKTKPFGKKPTPADQNESVGVSNSSAAASDDSVRDAQTAKEAFRRTQEAPLDWFTERRHGELGPLGAKSMSESPYNPVAPALANSIARA